MSVYGPLGILSLRYIETENPPFLFKLQPLFFQKTNEKFIAKKEQKMLFYKDPSHDEYSFK